MELHSPRLLSGTVDITRADLLGLERVERKHPAVDAPLIELSHSVARFAGVRNHVSQVQIASFFTVFDVLAKARTDPHVGASTLLHVARGGMDTPPRGRFRFLSWPPLACREWWLSRDLR